MATAVESTIPCDRCSGRIDLDDWSRHIKYCVGDGHSKTKQQNSVRHSFEDEPSNEGIPCEYCDVLINVDEWNSHSKICAEEHRQRIERLKKGIDSEPVDASIPCEYCDKPVSIHDLELHTRRCAEDTRRRQRESQKEELTLIPCEHCNNSIAAHEWEKHSRRCTKNRGDLNGEIENDQSVLIPCEYCNTPVAVHEWEQHTKRCSDAENKRLGDMSQYISKDQADALIPCEYCQQSFSVQRLNAHEKKCRRQQMRNTFQPDLPNDPATNDHDGPTINWDALITTNLTRHVVNHGTDEYQFVADRFHKTLAKNRIEKIERIQNRRWYRQYEAHKDDFIERYNKSSERWLFHGCRKSESAEAIIPDCFNRSHAVNCASGQGIYFATDAAISYGYTHADARGLRHMFLARVLVGKTTAGNPSMRVCPPGYDTTGGGNVFVTYHDAQAYAQYLIVFR